jgi:hypothetical protein
MATGSVSLHESPEIPYTAEQNVMWFSLLRLPFWSVIAVVACFYRGSGLRART